MRILVLGAGGVGAAFAAISRRRDFFDHMVLADIDPARAQAAVGGLDDGRFASTGIDASDRRAIVELLRAERADVILNACDPRLNPPIFEAAAKWEEAGLLALVGIGVEPGLAARRRRA